jgi:hypothetical protein
MKVHEFYGKYANTPLEKRFIVLSFHSLGMMTLHDVYTRIQQLEDKMRDDVIEEQHLLEEADWFFAKEE